MRLCKHDYHSRDQSRHCQSVTFMKRLSYHAFLFHPTISSSVYFLTLFEDKTLQSSKQVDLPPVIGHHISLRALRYPSWLLMGISDPVNSTLLVLYAVASWNLRTSWNYFFVYGSVFFADVAWDVCSGSGEGVFDVFHFGGHGCFMIYMVR